MKKERERAEREEKARKKLEKERRRPKYVEVFEGIQLMTLSTRMNIPLDRLQRKMSDLGFEDVDPTYRLSAEDASSVVLEYNMEPIVPNIAGQDIEARPEPEDWSAFPTRPPMVTIMGHVDHGKTTLLDSLRKTSVAAGEAGGITQHIGAFSVLLPSGQRITFMDTPGHAAFSAMRARGAKTTDIVVLVVAADDGIMPQTVEAIKHAKAAEVPIVVAINKCDKQNIDIRAVKEGLLRHEIFLEEHGGEIPAVEVSALTGKGLDELEETIVTMAEVMDLRGDPEGPVEGVVVEAKLVRGRGHVATMLVKRGTLRPGSVIVAGKVWCKVRVMHDENLNVLKEAGPAQPVEVLGWKEIPEAGDEVLEAESEELAKEVIKTRAERAKREEVNTAREVLNEKRAQTRQAHEDAKGTKGEEVKAEAKESREKVLNIILKGDVQGSVEALIDSIGALPAHEVRAHIVDHGVGVVTASDLKMAEATKAKILAFNVKHDKRIQSEAEKSGIEIKQYDIIYRLLEDLRDMLADMLPPEKIVQVTGEAEVLQVFSINVKKGSDNVAGCKIRNGKILKTQRVRIMRNGEEIYNGTLKAFKHHKKDITEAATGLECGLGFEGFKEFEQGDVIQAYTIIEKKRKLQ
ncbi:hypothetical protein HK097_006392 [Rhizophlyctis rosea]|uniref:Translation initiation factor IF-2, mitochondrial n=1 Tax=Rhizophlyctis rosea TaxID=64517 RepID=A0AAD5X5F0_9FUNG|nr:hypothetical protein HK097_006392 [Rhizophlyctis rosea]